MRYKGAVVTAISLCASMLLGGCGVFDNVINKNPHRGEAVISEELKDDQQESESVSEVEISNLEEKKDKKKSYKKILSDEKAVCYPSGVVVVGDTAYEQYNYVEGIAKTYTAAVNNLAHKTSSYAEVYEMIVPTSLGITFPDNRKKEAASSSEKKALISMKNMLSEDVTFVPLYHNLMTHRTEYIFYRTDHHWSQRGAYYGYNVFCKVKGITPHELDEYEKDNFGTFKGSFYAETDNAVSLSADKMKVWYPINRDKITMKYTNSDGVSIEGSIIEDGSKYGESYKYLAFIDGDNPYTVIKNSAIKDKSVCIVVKDSFGNAIVPYLADHYSKIIVIDYRYWEGDIYDLAKKEKSPDILLVNNISMTRNSYLVGKFSQLTGK